jgi:hypothetical protein
MRQLYYFESYVGARLGTIARECKGNHERFKGWKGKLYDLLLKKQADDLAQHSVVLSKLYWEHLNQWSRGIAAFTLQAMSNVCRPNPVSSRQSLCRLLAG